MQQVKPQQLQQPMFPEDLVDVCILKEIKRNHLNSYLITFYIKKNVILPWALDNFCWSIGRRCRQRPRLPKYCEVNIKFLRNKALFPKKESPSRGWQSVWVHEVTSFSCTLACFKCQPVRSLESQGKATVGSAANMFKHDSDPTHYMNWWNHLDASQAKLNKKFYM